MLRQKLVSFWRRPRFEQAFFIPTWLLLGVGRALVLLIPFRRLAPWLGENVGTTASVPLLAPHQIARAMQIKRVVLLASRYWPWDANCFAQALTARWLLALHGVPHALFFGVSRSAGGAAMRAHAWVAAGPVPVSGGSGFGEFGVVACFLGSTRPRCQAA